MRIPSMGDMALSYQQRSQSVRIKADLSRLTQELSSGRRADPATKATGDYSSIVSIQAKLTSAQAFSTTITEAGFFASTMQNALAFVQQSSSDLAPALLTASSSGHAGIVQTSAKDAEMKLSGVVAALNTRIADRSTFAGAATDRPALADSKTMLAALETAIAGQTTAAGVETAVHNWFFTAGGGFETVGYLGSDTPIGKFRLSNDEQQNFDLTAADPAIRRTLEGFVMAALSADGRSSLPPGERLELARRAGEGLLDSDMQLSVVRSAVGSAEARIDVASVRNQSETTALQIARAGLTEIDPFKTATELEAVQSQLETLYTLTARLSRLSLAEFLR